MIDNIKLFNKSLQKYCEFLFLHSIITKTIDKRFRVILTIMIKSANKVNIISNKNHNYFDNLCST